jgi:lysophospholipase L1-like esterase
LVSFREFTSTKSNTLIKLRTQAAAARLANPRNRGVMSAPPMITQDGTTLPSGQTTSYLLNTAAGAAVLKSYGGSVYTSGSVIGRVKSAVIGTTGGNIGLNDGAQASYGRKYFVADASKITLRLKRSGLPYRFLINGQYLDMTGTLTANSNPTSIDEFISLDFTLVGGRVTREIAVESQGDNGLLGVYVGPTETVREAPTSDSLTSCLLGDSYVYGSDATALGDGFGAVMADWLGIRAHTNSASGGTGWATTGSPYTFAQRIANGDLALGGLPKIIVLMGSYNDIGASVTAITANALAGLNTARALYPDAIIPVLGVFPGKTGPNSAAIAAENAVLAAVTQFSDYWTRFIPISTRLTGPLISGTGTIAALTGSGNSDIYTNASGIHPPTSGHVFIGRFCADAILSTFASD